MKLKFLAMAIASAVSFNAFATEQAQPTDKKKIVVAAKAEDKSQSQVQTVVVPAHDSAAPSVAAHMTSGETKFNQIDEKVAPSHLGVH